MTRDLQRARLTVSSADFERLGEMQRSYYRALRAAIATSSPAERVVVTDLAMLPSSRPVSLRSTVGESS